MESTKSLGTINFKGKKPREIHVNMKDNPLILPDHDSDEVNS
jgi:hypothetical protein